MNVASRAGSHDRPDLQRSSERVLASSQKLTVDSTLRLPCRRTNWWMADWESRGWFSMLKTPHSYEAIFPAGSRRHARLKTSVGIPNSLASDLSVTHRIFSSIYVSDNGEDLFKMHDYTQILMRFPVIISRFDVTLSRTLRMVCGRWSVNQLATWPCRLDMSGSSPEHCFISKKGIWSQVH